MNLSTLAILLGLLTVLLGGYGLWKPANFIAKARKFPRYTPIGVVFVLAATAWFEYYLSIESVSDFANLKTPLYFFFAAVGIGTCIFVQDFLPVRGLAALMLLMAKLMVDTAHLAETDWRLVIVVWAYLQVLAGMWFTVSPWRLRDMINWGTANEQRVRLLGGVRCAFGILVLVLGLTVFRGDEQRSAPEPMQISSATATCLVSPW
jgi:hypothetical protein